MTLNIVVEDGAGTGKTATVTEFGQLIVGPINYSVAANVELGTAATAGNLVEPVANKQVVITDILTYANRNVGVNDATVEIYEADSTVATSGTTIFLTEMLKQSTRDLTGLNIITTEGVYINAITDDDDVFVTIFYYFIPAV